MLRPWVVIPFACDRTFSLTSHLTAEKPVASSVITRNEFNERQAAYKDPTFSFVTMSSLGVWARRPPTKRLQPLLPEKRNRNCCRSSSVHRPMSVFTIFAPDSICHHLQSLDNPH